MCQQQCVEQTLCRANQRHNVLSRHGGAALLGRLAPERRVQQRCHQLHDASSGHDVGGGARLWLRGLALRGVVRVRAAAGGVVGRVVEAKQAEEEPTQAAAVGVVVVRVPRMQRWRHKERREGGRRAGVAGVAQRLEVDASLLEKPLSVGL